jgi:hypothetical protein
MRGTSPANGAFQQARNPGRIATRAALQSSHCNPHASARRYGSDFAWAGLNWILTGARDALRLLHGKYDKVLGIDSLPKGSDLHVRDKLLDRLPEDLFTESAGQGRLRWHRGAAHPILAGLEKSYIAEHGSGWLGHGELAKAAMLLPYGEKGFHVRDHHLLLQAVHHHLRQSWCWLLDLLLHTTCGNQLSGLRVSHFRHFHSRGSHDRSDP